MRNLTLLAAILITTISFTQCWKTIGMKEDTSSYILAIRNDHTLWAFSNDLNGIQIGSQAIFEKCYSSWYANFAISIDSLLWGWGENYNGVLGIGNTNSQPNIIQLNNDKWLDISTAWGTTVAVKADGTLWYWGNNWPNPDILTPTQLGTDNDWKEVQYKYGPIIIALKNNNTLWKKVGQGPFILVSPDTDWKFFWDEEWRIKNNGTLWNNGYQIGSDNNWKSIFNQLSFNGETFGIKTDGTLWLWDENANPLLNSPTQITTHSNYKEIALYPDFDGTNLNHYFIHNNNELWIEKYNNNAYCPNSTNGILQLNKNYNLLITPNPTAGDFTIESLELFKNIISMRVTDVNGKLVKELEPNASKFTLETVKPGVYFLSVTDGNKQEVIKLIKE